LLKQLHWSIYLESTIWCPHRRLPRLGRRDKVFI
jgi:hypothetical protein